MIALVNPPGIKSLSGLQYHTPNPPLGLAYIAAALKQAGHAYCVIDGTGEALDQISPYPDRADFMVQGLTLEEVVARIPRDASVVGITCLFSTLWPLTRRLAAAVRVRFPEAFLILGGEHGTAVPEHVLRSSAFDAVVLGEGEETIVNLLAAREAGRPLREVRGIAFLCDGQLVHNGLAPRKRDVDAIPWPDWDSFPLSEYIDRHQINGVNIGRSVPILATRGCPYECTFCSSPGMWTRRYIQRSPKSVVDEMEFYIRRYAASNFDFQDLTAIVSRRWAVAFCNELIERRLNVTWQMPSGTRSEVFDEEVADLLFRSGLFALNFAPESGSPEVLASVRKQVDLDRMIEAMRVTIRRGMRLGCFLVIGFPNDTHSTLRATLKLVRKLARIGIYDVGIAKFIPYPGSELFRRLCSEGKIELNDEFFVSPVDYYSTKSSSYCESISSRRLYWTMMWMYANFFAISFALWPLRSLKIVLKAVLLGIEDARFAKVFTDRLYTRRQWKRGLRRAPG